MFYAFAASKPNYAYVWLSLSNWHWELIEIRLANQKLN